MNQRKIEEEIIGVHEEELATLSKRDCRGGKLVWMRGGERREIQVRMRRMKVL